MSVKRYTGLKVAATLTIAILFTLMLTACFGTHTVITFQSNGGSPCESVTVEEGVESITLPTPTRDGYDFAGWFSNRALTESVPSVLTGEDIPAESVTFYAKWLIKRITVTFTAGNETVAELVFDYDTYVYEEDFPSLEKYPGYRWDVSSFKAQYDRTITATKIAVEDPEYTVSYYVPDGEGFSLYASRKGKEGTLIVSPENPVPESAGVAKYFAGWYYDADYVNPCRELPTAIGGANAAFYAKFEVAGDDSKYLFYEDTSDGTGVTIIGFTVVGGYQPTISVPSQIGGKPVVAIGREGALPTAKGALGSAFLKRIIIPASVREIRDWTFSGCSALEEVIFVGDAMTAIGKGAFAGCVSLTTFTLPDNVTSIGDYAFAGIGTGGTSPAEAGGLSGEWTNTEMRLTNFVSGAGSKLSSIGDYAFYNCPSLVSVKLGAVMRDFNYLAFMGSGIAEVEFYEGGNLVGVDGAVYSRSGGTLYYYPLNGGEEYLMPSGVTAVAPYAFYGNLSIKTVSASPSLSSLGEYAFGECAALSDVYLSDSVLVSVGDGAFEGCVSLKKIAFPATLVTLGHSAMESCVLLEEATFAGSALSAIGNNAFRGCEKLVSFTVPSDVASIGNYAFAECSSLAYLRFGAKSKLVSIGDYAFYECVSVGSVLLPSGITSIGKYAFASEKGRMEFEFDGDTDLSNVESIGDCAFMNTRVASVTISGKINSDEGLGKYVFRNCTMLKQAFFSPGGYSSVSEGLFYGCTSLTRIRFSGNIRTVGKYAFYNCAAMEWVEFGSEVKEILESAFEGCVSLTNPGDGQRVLPRSLTYLGERAFYNCVSLGSINIPSGLTSIEKETFARCSSLTDINYDDGATLTTIGENAFAYCVALERAALPASLAERNDYNTSGLIGNPFYGCSNLREYVFGGTPTGTLFAEDGVVYRKLKKASVDEFASERAIYAYPTAKSTAAFSVPTNVAVIDPYAFYGCVIRGLNFARNTEVAGTENVVLVSVGDYAFADTEITSANISFRVYEIGEGAFRNSNLAGVTVDETYIYNGMSGFSIINTDTTRANNILSIGAYAFAETPITAFTAPERTALLGEGALSSDYKLSSVQLKGGTLTELVLGARLFEGDNLITDITLPSSVSEVGAYAFYRCGNLASVRFASGGAQGLEIGDYAFAETHYLYEITLPSNVTSLGTGVFDGDTRLKYVVFPETLTAATQLEIPDRAFEGMPALTTITIPEYVVRIGEKAFARSALTTAEFLGTDISPALVIGKEAFANLGGLDEINLPANLTVIGERAFAYSALSEISYGAGKDVYIGDGAFEGTLISEFVATDRVKSIGKRSFAFAANLKKFTAANSVTEIPDMAFYGDSALSEVTLGNGVTALGRECFYGTGITQFVSETVTSVGYGAFSGSAVVKVSFLSSGALTIEERAFADARSLEEGKFEAAANIAFGENAFGGNASLQALSVKCATATLAESFASGATSLGDGFAFEETDAPNAAYKFDATEKVLYSSDGKKFVYYPAGKKGSVFTLTAEVTGIGDYAFYGNSGLTALIIEGEGVVKSENSFGDTSSDLTFYVAADLVEKYVNEWQTSGFAARTAVLGGFVLALQSSGDYSVTEYLGSSSNVEITGEMTDAEGKKYAVTAIGENAFRNNTVIETLVVGGGIKTIASGAFRNCYKLNDVKIGENVTSVKSYAFYNCSALESVGFTGESSLISIGNYAFANNYSLRGFTVPAGVESIGIFAFAGDYNLADVQVGEGLEEIGNNAFENCSALMSVSLPASLGRMGSYVFSGCDKLVYLDIGNPSVCAIESNTFAGTPESVYFFVPDSASARLYKADGVWRTHISKILSAEERCAEDGFGNYVLKNDGTGYTLVAYLGTEKDVVIVSEVSESVKITAIGEYAIGQFAENVTITEGVKEIGERAFFHAANLHTVSLPSSVAKIGNYAFAYLGELSSVTINGGSELSTIGNYAFYGCYGLTQFVLPASVREIGESAFSCPTGENMNLVSVEFLHDAVGGTDGTGATVYVAIGKRAFAYNDELKTITLNCRVSEIGDGAFDGCVGFESLYLNYNPRSASDAVASTSGNGVFGGCEKLSVFLPTTAITGKYKETWASDYDAHKLTAVSYKDAFGFVYAVTSTTNRQVTVINYLGSDEEVTFPTETQIGQDMYRVVRIGRERYGTSEEINGLVIGKNVRKVTVPSTVTTIGEDAFRNSENLKEVTLSSGVITIEGYAFAGCKKLTDITIPLSVTTIEAYAFYDCDSLNGGLRFAESIAPPSSPTLVIGGYAFADCDSLTSFYIPNHVRTIGGFRTTGSVNVGHTFENCRRLSSFTFSSDALITAIEGYIFANTLIEEIVLPRSLETVADYAFANCAKLTRVVIQREIGMGVSTPTSAGSNLFEGIDNPQLKVYVPESSYDVYAANRGWNAKTVIKNNVTPDGLFAYELDGNGESSYITLTDYRGADEIVVVPRIITLQSRDFYVTTIGKYFAGSYVRKVEFEKGSFVTALTEYAFAACYMLEEIHLPDGITTIGAHAFETCTELTDITLPAALSEIKEFTFYNCSSLSEITLPEEIQSIGPSAFYRCVNLSRVTVKFGKNLNESNVGASLGNSAFGDAGTGAGGLIIIVPDDKYAVFRSGWLSVKDNIYAAGDVVGDFVVKINDMGTALTLVQYLGDAEVIDLTEVTMKGLYVETVAENSVASQSTVFIVGKEVKYPPSMADRIQIKE